MKTEHIGINKFKLDTPCLVLDIDKLHNNLSIMQKHSTEQKINIRPHCKTHKCSKIAKLQVEYGAIGISAAKISEAEILVKNNIDNILITSPIVNPNKLVRLGRCIKKCKNISVVVDNEQNLIDLHQLASILNTKINVLIDIDSGIGRTGVGHISALSFLKKILNYSSLNFSGVQCYAGNLQHIKSFAERKKTSLEIMNKACAIVKDIKNLGIKCPILTGTGTGTYDIDIEASEVTEIQPGSYCVMDVEYNEIESQTSTKFTTFQNAMTLLTSVISSNRNEHVTVDAGTKAIYVDLIYKPKIVNFNELIYDWDRFGDEHGKITTRTTTNALPKNGSVLEMIVPHCDPTINLYDNFYITKHDIVIDIWPIDMRGKSQ